ncbi:hypothetical protein [Luteimonas sp. SDU82]|uniref:hypothetical protein n=1 Tax=Luteimonas sp. SDU82 TaxID=3422592 RepID=UPI003EBFDE13
MRFDDLVQRVREREASLEQRHAHARASWQGLRSSWREGWTPTRIVLAGLLTGFATGRVRPVRRVAGLPASRLVQIGTSLWSLAASFKAKDAARTAEVAAGDAGVAAEVAADTAGVAASATAGGAPEAAAAAAHAQAAAATIAAHRPGVSEARRRADPQWESAPRPAEAATELSER